MQIGFPTHCMTGGKVHSGDDHITTTKSDADFCFLPSSSVYWRSHLVVRIQTGWWGPWSVGVGNHIYWAQRRWRLHFVLHPWMLSRASYGISWYTFLRVKRLTDGGFDLGPAPCPYGVYTWDAVGVVGKQPSLLRPSWRSRHHGGEDNGSTGRG